MNGSEILRIVDAIHRDKNINQEIVFEGIEQAIASAARKHFGEESEISVSINRDTGEPTANVDGTELEPNEIGDLLGRIAAQTAKQVMIQKIREAERDALHEEYSAMKGQMVSGAIAQVTGGAATVNLGKVEGLLPRSEMIPGEVHRVGERVRAVVLEVKKAGSRVKIILSRTHPEMVRRLFELEIPEIAEHIIEVRSLAREAGYRSKVAVSCIDSKIDCIGACVGVRGSRIRNIVDELSGERIDIVRWNDSLQVLVPNSLQPAEVEDVILCPMLGKVIVLVRDDQLSLSIGKKGQNVRLASKLVGWDIHVLTQEKLDVLLDIAVEDFSKVPHITAELAENLVAQGFFTFDDLSVIEPDQLEELSGLSEKECEVIVQYADVESERLEIEEKKAKQEERALRRREAEIAEMEASAGVKSQPDVESKQAVTETKATETTDTKTTDTKTTDTQTTETPAAESPEDSAEIVPSDGEESASDVTEPVEAAEPVLDNVSAQTAETESAEDQATGDADKESGSDSGETVSPETATAETVTAETATAEADVPPTEASSATASDNGDAEGNQSAETRETTELQDSVAEIPETVSEETVSEGSVPKEAATES